MDRRARPRVSDVPAGAAIRGVPHDVESTAHSWEVRNVAERLDSRPEIGACDGVHRAITVVELGVERGAQGGGRREVERGRPLRQGMGDLRE